MTYCACCALGEVPERRACAYLDGDEVYECIWGGEWYARRYGS